MTNASGAALKAGFVKAGVIAGAAVLAACSGAFAQGRRPSPAPIRPEAPPIIVPQQPGTSETIPGLEDADARLRQAPLRREGAFIVRQRGSLLRLRTGEWLFVFHRDAAGNAERPMIVLPSQNLQRMIESSRLEAADAAERRPPTFLLTGQVFAYANRNYILATVPAPLVQADEGDERAEARDGGKPPVAGTPERREADPRADPAVQALIRELEAGGERPRTLQRGMPDRAVADGAEPGAGTASAEPGSLHPDAGGTRSAGSAAGPLVPEGTIITGRRARVVRLGGSEWAAVFDSGPAGAGVKDPPMVLAPCLALDRLGQIMLYQPETTIVELSGKVLAFRGRNYLLPTMYRLATPTELRPMR